MASMHEEEVKINVNLHVCNGEQKSKPLLTFLVPTTFRQTVKQLF